MIQDISLSSMRVTPAQEAVLIGQSIDPQNFRFNASFFLHLPENINEKDFLRAMELVAREATLQRVKLQFDGNKWQQSVQVPVEDVNKVIHFETEQDAKSWMMAEWQVPASLYSDPLYCQWLVKTNENASFYFVKYHHSVMDGFGQSLMLKRLSEVYGLVVQGNDLKDIRSRWTEDNSYIISALKHSADKLPVSLERAVNDFQHVEHIPTLGVSRSHFANAGVRQVRHSLDKNVLIALHEQAHTQNVPEAAIIVAAVASFIYQVAGTHKVSLGLPVTGRTNGSLLNKPSMQSNEWPLYFDFSQWVDPVQGISLAPLVQHAKQQVAFAIANQGVRNEVLHNQLNRIGWEEKLTKTLVNILPFGGEVDLASYKVPVQQLATGPVNDLNINVFIKSTHIELLWDANPDNYTQEQLTLHAERFAKLLEKIVTGNDTHIHQSALYLAQDKWVLACLQGAKRNWDLHTPLCQLIDDQANIFPDKVAVECDNYQFTYAQLKAQSDHLALQLIDSGVQCGAAVGLYGKRASQMVVALLAIQKAGGAYVPLDPDLPEERLSSQIQQANIQLILHWDFPPPLAVNAIKVDFLDAINELDVARLPKLTSNLAAYIIFTSGSTGAPKGVAVSHAAIANRILWMQSEYDLTQSDCVLQKTPFTFDVSVWEFFWPLSIGARLVMAPPDVHKDPRVLLNIIEKKFITTLHFVPPMLDLFLREVNTSATSITRIFASGEALGPATVRETFKRLPSVQLHNLYGPTEAAVDVSYWACSPADANRVSVPIGKPVANTDLWVLNNSLQPALPGVPGELYIGGPQVALGYVNQPALTAERFVEIDGIDGVLYRTGDLVVLSGDDGLEFLGRLDHQVKIRGLRIELAEIESVLLAFPIVKQAVVSVINSNTPNPRLVAYLVMAEQGGLHELQTDIAKYLPDYMVPHHWQILDELPLTANGKVNRRELPEPVLDVVQIDSETQSEHLLKSVWESVLGLVSIGVETPFFSLGGDSMMAIRVRAELEQRGWTFELAQLFRNPTIRQLATQLSAHQTPLRSSREPMQDVSEADRALLPDGLEDAFPMSAMQESMVYQAEIDQSSSVYRVVTSLKVELPLVRAHLDAALQLVFQRHPLLRSSFDLSSYSQPLVLVHPNVSIPIHYDEAISSLDSAEQQAFIKEWVESAKFQTFDLSQAPGLRFYVHASGQQSFQLSVVEHHVVLDGWSDLLMFDEIVEQYSLMLANKPASYSSLSSHYADFVAEEKAILLNQRARDYWLSITSAVDASPLPRRELSCETSHRSYHANIAPALNDSLLALAKSQQCSIKSLLVAAHLVVLGAITGNSHVATGSVFNGRIDQADGDKVIGVFLNTLPLSLSLENRSFIDIAREVAEFEFHSYEFGRFPFTAMQRESQQDINLDSYVNYMDFHRQWGEGSVVSEAFGVANTNFPLAVNFLVDPVSQSLSLWFDCDIGKLESSLCERLPEYYQRVLAEMVRSPSQLGLEVSLITAVEHQQLASWNATEKSLDTSLLVHQQFELQAAKNPHRPAVAWLDNWLSYHELNQLANRIAHALISAGIAVNDTVGVCVPRCPELVASMLAIHKVGAAFLPLDPKYPIDRLNYIVQDSALKILLTHSVSPDLGADVSIAVDSEIVQSQDDTNPGCVVELQANAYVIYTSGSTGLPKGTVISHYNLLNFLMGMDDVIGCSSSDALLALTSASFDISILELFWPLTKGAKLVIGNENQIHNLVEQKNEVPANALDFSLFFFGAASGMDGRQSAYQLVLDAARFADRNNFKAIWTPERHFHEFGGLYPNPSVLSAALAVITEHIELRSGSVVAPLHDSLRLAEEWALVDNLSRGRIGLAFASGWNTNDFALAPENYANRKAVLLEKLQQLRSLWQGEKISRINGDGDQVELSIFPQPVNPDLPVWLTSSGAPSTFEMAGTYGLNVLTHLLGQDIQELTDKIAIYRAAWAAAGHQGQGRVSLMIHTFLLSDEQEAKGIAKGPFREYLRTSAGLLRQLTASMGVDFPESMDDEDMESVLDLAVDRYFEESGLFGSPDSVIPLLQKLQVAGVDEIASLIDFGVSNDDTLRSLHSINQMRLQHLRDHQQSAYSCERLVREHQVSILQSTPSFMTAAMSEPALVNAFDHLKTLMIGGEPFPAGLAAQLNDKLHARVFNMYGPTETTIWSSVHRLTGNSIVNNRIPIGRPIANTLMKVLNTVGQEVPVGVPGELWIGGDGVCSGYWNRPELTADRFKLFDDNQKYYRTGDRVVWQPNGELLFMGRVDRQVKLRGHRIELDEIEGVLSRHQAIRSVAVVLQDAGQGSSELLAYIEADISNLNLEETHHRVQHWGQLWDNAYRDRQAINCSNNRAGDFAGWLSSYTGEPISLEEMEEWLDHTLRKVAAYNPEKIVDVGVGMGLYLRRLIQQCERYTGIDLSEEALVASREAISPQLRAEKQLTLIQGDALALNQLPEGHADFILINSVIQYFPGNAYLTDALSAALRVLSASGIIFVGDVRSLDDLMLFHTMVQFHKANALTPLSDIKTYISRHFKMEKELCLAPAYFDQLCTLLPGIGKVEMELKRGLSSNELVDFRYDVILHADKSQKVKAEEWAHKGSALSNDSLILLASKIKEALPEKLYVRGIPNHRLDKPRRIAQLLESMAPDATKWDLEKRLWELEVDNTVMPEALASYLEREGYTARLLINAEQGLGYFDLELTAVNPSDRERSASATAREITL